MSTEAQVVSRCLGLQNSVFRLAMQAHKTDGEKRAVDSMVADVADILGYVVKHQGDLVTLRSVEREQVRPLATTARQYGLRNNVTFAKPLFGLPSTTGANRYAVFGGEDLQNIARIVADSLDLEEVDAKVSRAPIDIMWNAVCESNFVIFDYRQSSWNERAWPRYSYALGLALSVGTFPVVVTDNRAMLPFDINIEPVVFDDESTLTSSIEEAMAEAAVSFLDTQGMQSSVLTTAHEVLRVGAESPNTEAFNYMRKSIQAECSRQPVDPVTTRLYLTSIITQLFGSGASLLSPVWPGAYPNPASISCFHILPFALDDDIPAAVEMGCGSDKNYVRGDTTGDIDVIRGIWEGIGMASFVVVDLTPAAVKGLHPDKIPNANVCLELAMAQVLNRPVLLVADQRKSFPKQFPEIAKLQVKIYTSPLELTEMVTEFIDDATKHDT